MRLVLESVTTPTGVSPVTGLAAKVALEEAVTADELDDPAGSGLGWSNGMKYTVRTRVAELEARIKAVPEVIGLKWDVCPTTARRCGKRGIPQQSNDPDKQIPVYGVTPCVPHTSLPCVRVPSTHHRPGCPPDMPHHHVRGTTSTPYFPPLPALVRIRLVSPA